MDQEGSPTEKGLPARPLKVLSTTFSPFPSRETLGSVRQLDHLVALSTTSGEVKSRGNHGKDRGRAPLTGDEAVVRLLLEHKIDVDAKDKYGVTP